MTIVSQEKEDNSIVQLLSLAKNLMFRSCTTLDTKFGSIPTEESRFQSTKLFQSSKTSPSKRKKKYAQ